MANKELRVKIQDAYDTEFNWKTNDPVLLAGQVAFSSDNYGKYKVGDGVKTWNQLEYVKTKWEDIDGKPSTFNPPAHTHTISQISDIGNASVKHANTAGSANAVAWANVSGKPSTFNPATHNHDDRYYTETEMNTKLGEKANTSALTSHTGNNDIHVTSIEKTNWNAAKAHADKAHAPSNAQANQNAFSNVTINGTTISADVPTDTLNLVAGSNVQITPDAANDKITISATDTKYTHPGTHPASMITQDTSHRFVTDTEKNTWNGKANASHIHKINQVQRGTYNYTGSVSVINRSLFDSARACRTAFMPASAIKVEYTNNNGDTWIDYELNNEAKTKLFAMTQDGALRLGGASGQMKVGNGLRITIKAIDRYVSVDTFYCWFSTGGSQCVVNIEKATKATPTSFQSVVNNTRVDGWSGANEIGFGSIPFGGGSNQTSNIDSLRFTFLMTQVGTVSTNYATVTDIRLYGDNCWASNNPMMSNDHMYTWDYNKNVSFPGDVKGTSFHGNLIGNATTATKLGTETKGSATQPIYLNAGVPTACTYTLGKSVPSNAVFTDTTYSVASGSTNGLMSSTDKTKLDGIATGANKYVLPTAGLNALGGVKTTSQVTSASGYTACPIIGGVPYYKDTNTTYTLGSFGITATAAELNFCDGVTSNIQTQLNGKAPSSHNHSASQITGLPNVVAITNSQIDSLKNL